ncbi:hypothetical protein FS837_002357 [Tulasnella sp. UAMH 9824]|nr:hypothetical protein FS837_002357 [Tulasnella sp. UAMH 9824]
MSASRSPDARKTKRLRLDPSVDDEEDSAEEGPPLPPAMDADTSSTQLLEKDGASESDVDDQCVICLQMIVDRTVLPACAHDRFCFECLEMWAGQSRKHIASNPYTRFKPYPTPQQFAASQDLISRTTTFIRRELQVWTNLDVEFLTSFILALMKSIDIRSESAVKLLGEFLDMDSTESGRRPNAEHFAHELYTYLRSPYRDLAVYDSVIQYDQPPSVPSPPTRRQRHDRWVAQSRPATESSRPYSSRYYSRRNEVDYRSRHHPSEQSDDDDILERSPRDIDSPQHRSPPPLSRRSPPESQREFRDRRARYRSWSRSWSRDEGSSDDQPDQYHQGPSQQPSQFTRRCSRSRDLRHDRRPVPSHGMRADHERPPSQGLRSKSPEAVRRRSSSYDPRDQSPEPSRSDRRSHRSPSSPNTSGKRSNLIRSPSENSERMEYNDTVILQLSIKGASKPIAESTSIPALGLSIKGQAAKMGLKRTKSSDEEGIPHDQTQESVRDVDLPSLLARMTDPAHSREKRTSTDDVAPSVADIMVRTRRQLSIKRKGKAKVVDSNDGLGEDLEPSSRQQEYVYEGAQQPLDNERRAQLMARLAEERKKFLQSKSSPTNDAPEPNESPQPHKAQLELGSDAREQRLRTQARLRVKLALEKRKASTTATDQTLANSTPISASLSPINITPNPAKSTSTPKSILLEDGLKEKLKQRRAGASTEGDRG